MKNLFFKIILIVLFIGFGQNITFADPFADPISATASAPIDSGVLALVAGGLALGYRKWKSSLK